MILLLPPLTTTIIIIHSVFIKPLCQSFVKMKHSIVYRQHQGSGTSPLCYEIIIMWQRTTKEKGTETEKSGAITITDSV